MWCTIVWAWRLQGRVELAKKRVWQNVFHQNMEGSWVTFSNGLLEKWEGGTGSWGSWLGCWDFIQKRPLAVSKATNRYSPSVFIQLEEEKMNQWKALLHLSQVQVKMWFFSFCHQILPCFPHGFPRGKTCRSCGGRSRDVSTHSFSFIYSFWRQYFGPKYDLKLFTSSVCGCQVPERKSLSLIYAFFLSAPGTTPNKTKTLPFVVFKNLKATSKSGSQTDAQLAGYAGLQWHLIRYEDMWKLVDTGKMCATAEDVTRGDSDAVDHLIVHKVPGQSSNNVYGYQVNIGQESAPQKMTMLQHGVYFLVFSNCGSFDQAVVSGQVVVKNSHGYLPANEYGKMPFYAIMTAVTVVVFLIWSLICIRWWKVLFNIHLSIGSLCFVAILESIAWFVYLFSWNEGGAESVALFSISIFLSVSRNTLSYMLILSACLGWGVTKPLLDGGTICRMVSLSVVYISLNVVREVVLADRHTQSVPVPFVILCLLPVSCMNGGIFYWIFAALSNLMETLEAQGQSAKLGLFQKLWWVLVLAIAFAFVVLLAQIFIIANDSSSWQYQWLVTDFAPQAGFLFVLLCVMYLWCPNEDTQRFAYSAQLEGENDELGGVEKAEVISGDENDVDVIGASRRWGRRDDEELLDWLKDPQIARTLLYAEKNGHQKWVCTSCNKTRVSATDSFNYLFSWMYTVSFFLFGGIR